MSTLKSNTIDKLAGAMYGFAIGDAMGATTEFMAAADIKRIYGVVDDIIGGGWLHLHAGEVTDDTEMMMCVARALQSAPEPENDAMATKFLLECRAQFMAWYRSHPRDVGNQCARAIQLMLDGHFGAPTSRHAIGNGSLMRALPCALVHRDLANELQGRLTHNNKRCTAAIEQYADNVNGYMRYGMEATRIQTVLQLVTPVGTAANTLNNVLYHAWNASTFEDGIIAAVNNGGDADTIAALAGGLLGARFGFGAIPVEWSRKLDSNVRRQLDEFVTWAYNHR